MILGCLALFLGISAVSFFDSGCGSSNNATAPAPVTVTLQPTPYTGAEYGYGFNVSGTDSPLSSANLYAESITIPATSKTLSISLYTGSTATGIVEMFVYTDNGSTYPHTLMDSGVILSVVPNQWNTVPLNNVSLPAGNYWIGFQSQSNIHVVSSSLVNFFSLANIYTNPPSSTMPAGGTVTAAASGFAMVLDTTF